jgi:hypothetical protein
MLRLPLIVLLAITGLWSSGAQAAIVTVGPPLEEAIPLKGGFGGSPILVANSSLPAGLNATSPVSGRVIRWRVNQTMGGPFRLRVLRPGGGDVVYATVGTSERENSLSLSMQTFPTSIPIQAGDTIGLEATEPAGDSAGFLSYLGEPEAAFTYWSPPPPDGVPTKGEFPDTEEAFAFNADVQPTPAVTAVSPASGNIRGGTTVTLTGADLVGASSVHFGEKFATSFSVDPTGQITAVTPGASVPGPVSITVTTPGGTTGAGTPQFTYEACRVPKLKGKRLKRARKRLRRSNCKLGKVKRVGDASSRTGRVVGQRPTPGKFKPPGFRVRVTLK